MGLEELAGYTVTQLPKDYNNLAPPPIPPVEEEFDPIKTTAEHTIHPMSHPLITAIDHGVADKKFMNPLKLIDEGILSGDEEKVGKGHEALSKMILGPESFGDWYNDIVAGHSEQRAAARRVAGDVVMQRLQRHTGLGKPSVEEALRFGLIQPSELLPGQQLQESYGVLRDQGILPQHGESPTVSLIPGAELTPFQGDIVSDRRAVSAKGRQHTDPAGLQEFNMDVAQQMKAHIEKTGLPPTEQDKERFVAIARNRYEKEPLPGGLQADKLVAATESERAQIGLTKEKTTTEATTRPFNIHETQAKTARDLAITHEALERAKDYAERGQVLEQRVELEKARGGLQEVRSQISTMLGSIASADLTKEDNLKVLNRMNELLNTGMEMSRRAGKLGLDFLDFGKPNVNIELAPTKEKSQGEQKSRYQPPKVDPYEFAGLKPLESPIKVTPTEPTTSETTQVPPSTLTPEQDLYNRLRRSGLSKEQAMKELQKSR